MPGGGEWIALLVRWAHIVVGAAWIGTSFYFNWLNDMIRPPATRAGAAGDTGDAGVQGELWAIHGGGFYRVAKYEIDAERIPAPAALHWFKWEAYTTWLTGTALLVLVYWLGAAVYMVDATVATIAPGTAVAIGAGTVVGGWVAYEVLCRTALIKSERTFALVGLALIALTAYALAQFLSGRAAYMHVGAALGTIMAANVFRGIIPAQRALVRARAEGRPPDVALSKQAALRSRHNNYLTLPVLFVMVSNHYPLTYGSRWGWAVLVLITVAGIAVRHWFNRRHQSGTGGGWTPLGVAAASLLLAAILAGGARPGGAPRGVVTHGDGAAPTAAAPSFASARSVLDQRCRACHSSAPSEALFPTPPLGVMFDTPEQISAFAERIRVRAVEQRTMPLNNLTRMTDEERALLGAWIAAGARVR